MPLKFERFAVECKSGTHSNCAVTERKQPGLPAWEMTIDFEFLTLETGIDNANNWLKRGTAHHT